MPLITVFYQKGGGKYVAPSLKPLIKTVNLLGINAPKTKKNTKIIKLPGARLNLKNVSQEKTKT